jgi:hypothetical protein
MRMTIQLCPLDECYWINDIIETDEDSVFAASQKTLAHLLEAHPTLENEIWKEIVLTRVPFDEVEYVQTP